MTFWLTTKHPGLISLSYGHSELPRPAKDSKGKRLLMQLYQSYTKYGTPEVPLAVGGPWSALDGTGGKDISPNLLGAWCTNSGQKCDNQWSAARLRKVRWQVWRTRE